MDLISGICFGKWQTFCRKNDGFDHVVKKRKIAIEITDQYHLMKKSCSSNFQRFSVYSSFQELKRPIKLFPHLFFKTPIKYARRLD